MVPLEMQRRRCDDPVQPIERRKGMRRAVRESRECFEPRALAIGTGRSSRYFCRVVFDRGDLGCRGGSGFRRSRFGRKYRAGYLRADGRGACGQEPPTTDPRATLRFAGLFLIGCAHGFPSRFTIARFITRSKVHVRYSVSGRSQRHAHDDAYCDSEEDRIVGKTHPMLDRVASPAPRSEALRFQRHCQ